MVPNCENSFGRTECCWWRPDIHSPIQHIPFLPCAYHACVCVCFFACLGIHSKLDILTLIVVLLHSGTNFPAVNVNSLLAVAKMKNSSAATGQEFQHILLPKLRLLLSQPEIIRKKIKKKKRCFFKDTRLLRVYGMSVICGWNVGMERWWNDEGRIRMEHSEMAVSTDTLHKKKNQRDLTCNWIRISMIKGRQLTVLEMPFRNW
jgi:hypothetical protein